MARGIAFITFNSNTETLPVVINRIHSKQLLLNKWMLYKWFANCYCVIQTAHNVRNQSSNRYLIIKNQFILCVYADQ